VVAEVALAFVLLSGAGLLGLSLERAMALSPGFRPENILTGQVSMQGKNYRDGPALLAFTERLQEELARQPGVLAAGIVTNVPFSGNSGKSAATVMGHLLLPGESLRGHYSYGVGGDYFTALGFSLREGRFLVADDSRRTERVCVVDEDFARRYWPRGSAIGQRLFQGSQAGKDADAFTVVGVVGAAKQAGLTEEDALGAVFYPFIHRNDRDVFVVARTNLRPESLATTLRQAVRSVDSELPVNDIRSMETRIADSLQAILFQVPALHVATLAATGAILGAVSLAACLLPSHRAARISPVEALADQ